MRRALLISGLAISCLAAGVFLVRSNPPAADTTGTAAPNALPGPSSATSAAANAPATAAGAAAVSPETQPRLETVHLRPRDTLTALLGRHGLAADEAHALTRRLKEAGMNNRAIRPRDAVQIGRAADGSMVVVGYAPSAWERFEARREQDAWQVRRIAVQPEVRLEVREARIESSLWDAVESGAIDAQTILDLVAIFESDFDFAVDTQPGDRFRLLMESRYSDGRFIESGRILAARYEASDEVLTGVGFEVDGQMRYYDAQGQSLKKSFLKSPLQFTRISSGYTHRRPHPVLGGVRPHLAIDYAAPVGTPVWAVADGTVEFAGWKGGNGIQVLVRHRGSYKTYYNHLSRVAKGIRPGVRVAQKQVIGYVGSTGLSTGPHLDYRVSANGRFVNPLNEKFLPGDPVPPQRRAQFEAHARDVLARLDPAAAPAASPAGRVQADTSTLPATR